jgi:hypothetical protein
MQPLDKAKAQLQKARRSLERMKVAQSLDKYEEEWVDFLHNLERTWNKTVNHLGRSPKYQGWSKRTRTECLRRQDPLLSYLLNARGAEEHTIAQITEKEMGGIGISPAEGSELLIHHMSISKGVININADRPIKIVFIPGKVKLLPVVNRSRTYDPPQMHLGKDVGEIDPIKVAELGITFYEDYIKEAESYFV